MTKKQLKAAMIQIIDRAYEREEQAKDECVKQSYRGEVAGIELLAATLKIDLWKPEKYPVFEA